MLLINVNLLYFTHEASSFSFGTSFLSINSEDNNTGDNWTFAKFGSCGRLSGKTSFTQSLILRSQNGVRASITSYSLNYTDIFKLH